MNIMRWSLVALLLLTGCATSEKPDTDSLLAKLQHGGYVIFFRHAATDHSQKDTDKKNLANCDSQRRLSDVGRQQSQVIGEAFRSLGIPVGEVTTSEYCRCINTAKIAFGKATPSMDITSIQDVSPEVKAQRIENLRNMLNTVPAAGTNTVLVAHKWMFKYASGQLIDEGEAVIFKPQSTGSALMVQRVKPEHWKNISQVVNKQ